MNCSMARRVLILLWGAGAGLYPLSSLALGLGELQVESRLNQPLRARIEVSDVSDEEWRLLRAHLSSQTSQADGLSRPGLLESVTFKSVEDENHRRFIELRSVEAFTEPLFDLSVDVSGASLRVTRNYTVFLDPPGPDDDLPGLRGPALVSQPAAGRASAQSETPAHAGASVVTPEQSEPRRRAHAARKRAADAAAGGTAAPALSTGAGGSPTPTGSAASASARGSSASAGASGAAAPSARVAQSNASNASYTVSKSDTLGRIARRFAGPTAASRNQFMDWVFQHNPAAFYGGMNRLRAGARLVLPGTLAAGGEAAKSQLQGELTNLQQELTGLQKMIAQQDAQIASLKQQLVARQEEQHVAQEGRAPVATTIQPDAARSTAALAHADQDR